MSIADRIRAKREERKVTQEHMAERLGISQNAYSQLELGRTKITLDRLQRIMDELETPIEEFLNDTGQVTVNIRSQHGPNGYHAVQNQQVAPEMLEMLGAFAALVKEQQRQNAMLMEILAKGKA